MMTAPGIGALPLSGFAHQWWLVFAVVPVGLAAIYLVAQARRSARMRRFTDPELLETVAPQPLRLWRHLPIAVLVVALLLLTVALAGPPATSAYRVTARSSC